MSTQSRDCPAKASSSHEVYGLLYDGGYRHSQGELGHHPPKLRNIRFKLLQEDGGGTYHQSLTGSEHNRVAHLGSARSDVRSPRETPCVPSLSCSASDALSELTLTRIVSKYHL
eukprot:1192015-Prorocentrum_minimum.AAC.1